MDRPPLDVFFSYSHRDEDLRDELEVHLALLKRQGRIRPWHAHRITPGGEWAGEIDVRLERADVVLLLVTPAFMASDYCWDVELKRAMQRHEEGTARVIPIILRPTEWKGAPFGKLAALPKNGKPVTLWRNRDEAFVDVVRGISAAIEAERQRRGGAGGRSGPARGAAPPAAGGSVRARSIRAKHVAGVQLQGADAETAARLAATGISGEVDADEIVADDVAGLQLDVRREVESLDGLRGEVAALRQAIEQLTAAVGGGVPGAEEARAELAVAADELARPEPAAGAVVPKLERAAEILEQGSKTVAAADRLGSSAEKLASAARAAWQAASLWFGA